MGPLDPSLELQDRPPSEVDLPSARGSEADLNLEGLDPSPKRGDRSKLREMPMLLEDTLITAPVRPTEQLLTETHPALSGDSARARTPELVEEAKDIDSKPPSSAPPPEEKKLDEELLSEEEDESDAPMAGHGRRGKKPKEEEEP